MKLTAFDASRQVAFLPCTRKTAKRTALRTIAGTEAQNAHGSVLLVELVYIHLGARRDPIATACFPANDIEIRNLAHALARVTNLHSSKSKKV
jgi:hypothetical protein